MSSPVGDGSPAQTVEYGRSATVAATDEDVRRAAPGPTRGAVRDADDHLSEGGRATPVSFGTGVKTAGSAAERTGSTKQAQPSLSRVNPSAALSY
jgi:hypothetical protein